MTQKEAKREMMFAKRNVLKGSYIDQAYDKAIEALSELERKKGKWIDDGKGLYMCSSCGKLWVHWWARVVPLNQMCKELRYCPMCGADMRDENDE